MVGASCVRENVAVAQDACRAQVQTSGVHVGWASLCHVALQLLEWKYSLKIHSNDGPTRLFVSETRCFGLQESHGAGFLLFCTSGSRQKHVV